MGEPTVSSVPEGGLLPFLRSWWFVVGLLWTVLTAIVSGVAVGSYRVANYEALEREAAAKLLLITSTNESLLARISALTERLTDMAYTVQTNTGASRDLADHVHALDARADAIRAAVGDLHEQWATQNERILFLLDRSPGAKR